MTVVGHRTRVTTAVKARALRPKVKAVARAAGLANPLLRNAHLLSISSGLSNLVGMAYWALAARRYDIAIVGKSTAAISAMMLLAGVSQLNLMSAMTRFVPTAGRWTRSLVLVAYAASVGVALVTSSVFLLLLHRVAPQLTSLIGSGWMAAVFVLSTMAACVFVLQDAVLTAVRKAQWVAYENTVFALAKVALVVGLATLLPTTGIFLSWSIGFSISLALANVYLFTKAIPRHMARSTAAPRFGLGAVARFTALDYLGALAWILATTLLPVLIINERGPQASAYFSIAWLLASSLYFVSTNMGVSLVVETAADQSSLAHRCWEVIRHSSVLIALGAGVLVAAAQPLLTVFGADYGSHSVGTLRLLALSALPNIVTATAVSACRAQRRTGAAVVILACLCGSVLAGTVLALPHVGIIGAGWAWLGAQTLVAAGLATKRTWWLPGTVNGTSDVHP